MISLSEQYCLMLKNHVDQLQEEEKEEGEEEVEEEEEEEKSYLALGQESTMCG
jgi:hypothetical protein